MPRMMVFILVVNTRESNFSIFRGHIKSTKMKKYIVYLPIFLLFIATSCSEESNDDPKEQAKEESKKALEDREPQVKEYLDAVDALVGEYFTLAEGMLDSYDKMNEDDLDTFEKIALLADMSSAALEVERLTE